MRKGMGHTAVSASRLIPNSKLLTYISLILINVNIGGIVLAVNMKFEN